MCHLEKERILFALLSLKKAVIVQLTKQSPKQRKREHVMKGLRVGCDFLYYAMYFLCVYAFACVCACVCHDRLSPFGETANYLQFAEKANLSLTVLLKLQYTAGAAYREERSHFLCVRVCLCIMENVEKAPSPLCTLFELTWVLCHYADVSTYLWFAILCVSSSLKPVSGQSWAYFKAAEKNRQGVLFCYINALHLLLMLHCVQDQMCQLG